MKLTCNQMDVLISFYIDGDLSTNLKQQVESHLKTCPTCQAKFDIINSMLKELKSSLFSDKSTKEEANSLFLGTNNDNSKNNVFKTNLSAYIDNELSNEENIKIKKITISNSDARKELESNYKIRKLMNDSFQKSKLELKQDFTRSVLKQLEVEDDTSIDKIHPFVKLIFLFTISVSIVTIIVLFSL